MGTTQWSLDVQTAGSTDVREGVQFSWQDCYDIGRGSTANFIMHSDRVCTMSVIPPSMLHKVKDMKSRPFGEYSESDNEKMVPMVVFDCRGVQPARLRSPLPVIVETNDGTVFEGVDLADGNWWRADVAPRYSEPEYAV